MERKLEKELKSAMGVPEKSINDQVVDGVRGMEEEGAVTHWLSDRQLYRADEICTALKLPYHFRLW